MQVKAGSIIRTDVPCRSDVDQRMIPAGAHGVVRKVFTDQLGGYRVEVTADDKSVHSATLYPYQFTLRSDEAATP